MHVGIVLLLMGWRSYPDALTVATPISSSQGGLGHLGAIVVDINEMPQSSICRLDQWSILGQQRMIA